MVVNLANEAADADDVATPPLITQSAPLVQSLSVAKSPLVTCSTPAVLASPSILAPLLVQ